MTSNHSGTRNLADARVTVGCAVHPDAVTAARQSAREALQRLPEGVRPGWLLAFAGGQHAPAELLQGWRAVLGDLPVVGGCGSGLITAAAASSSGYECGVLLFPDVLLPTAILSAEGLEDDEYATGHRLGADLRALELTPAASVLLFYDSIACGSPPVLHLGSRLLDGLYTGLADCRPRVIGAGTLADLALSGGYVFDGRQILRHAVVAVVLAPELSVRTTIMHGCLPASDFLRITRLEGARVLELDGRPALGVVEERLGVTREELLARQPLPSITLGEKHGDPYAPFSDGQYVNRLVMAIDPDDEALVLFEADFSPGSRIQLMAYEPWRMISSAREQTRELLELAGQDDLLCALYIDCAGRSIAFSGMDEDESGPVRELLGPRCPLLGFYSGVEIAPFMGRSRPLDWTGVLALFALHP